MGREKKNKEVTIIIRKKTKKEASSWRMKSRHHPLETRKLMKSIHTLFFFFFLNITSTEIECTGDPRLGASDKGPREEKKKRWTRTRQDRKTEFDPDAGPEG